MTPHELCALQQWLAWKYVTKRGTEKPTKIPLDPHRDGLASSTDPSTWGTYQEALATSGANGIGFVFTPDDPYCGVDLDSCVAATGALHDAAYRIVRDLNGYVEFSPSGSGLHIIVRGRWRSPRHKTLKTPWGDELAVYDRGRYFTMTGDGRGAIADAQPALDALMAEYFPAPGVTPPTTPPKPLYGDDVAVVERILAELRMAALWAGETADHAGDHSAADLALCNHLAFFCGHDPARIDALFRRSGLMRDKWDERRGDSTYGGITIHRAITGG